MNVELASGKVEVGTIVADILDVDNDGVDDEKDEIRVSVTTNGVNMSAAAANKEGKYIVKTAAGMGLVDEIDAKNTYISGDVRFEADENGVFQVVDTTLNGDVNVTGKLTAENGLKVNTSGEGSFSIGNIAGNTLFYAMSTEEGKNNPTIVMNAQNGNIETQGSLSVGNGAFVSDAASGNAAVKGSMTVGGDAAIAGGLNVGTDVVANGTSLKATAAQAEENKQAIADNVEDIEALEGKTQNITATEGKTTFATKGNGKITINSIAGNTMIYGTDAEGNYTVGINAETGGVESNHISVGGGAFVANATGAAVNGSLTVNGNAAITGGLNVGTDVVANGTSLKATAAQAEENKQAIADNVEDIEALEGKTQNITATEGKTTFATKGNGKITINSIAGNTMIYGTDAEGNYTVGINAETGGVESNHISVGGGAFVANATGAAVNGSLTVNGNAAITGGLNVGTDVVAGDVSLRDLAENVYTKAEVDEYRAGLQEKLGEAQQQVADKFAEVEADYKAADSKLQAAIEKETAAREDADAELRADFEAADSKLQANIDKEAAAREEADAKLQANIDAEAQARQEADNKLQANIDANAADIATNASNIAANKQAIDAEVAARQEADAALSDAIDNVVGDIADTKAQVADNKAAIEENAQDIANEVAAREAADNKLQANIDKESVDRQIADAKEAAARAEADAELQGNIDAEEQARKDADAAEAKVRSEEDQRIESKFDGEVNRLDNRIDKVDAKIDKVGAMAAAMASLKTMGYDPEAPTEIAVGIGQYRNETGIAIGAFHYPNKNFMLNFSLSTAGDEVMGGIGATWKIGRKR